MRIPVRLHIAFVLALFCSGAVSCARIWRGDGPPDSLDNTVWIGTNKARGEILEFRFGAETAEGGPVLILFSKPGAAAGRDTVFYEGSYRYSRYPADNATGSLKADVSLEVCERQTQEKIPFSMSFSNMRFFVYFNDGYYPADPEEVSDYESILGL